MAGESKSQWAVPRNREGAIERGALCHFWETECTLGVFADPPPLPRSRDCADLVLAAAQANRLHFYAALHSPLFLLSSTSLRLKFTLPGVRIDLSLLLPHIRAPEIASRTHCVCDGELNLSVRYFSRMALNICIYAAFSEPQH